MVYVYLLALVVAGLLLWGISRRGRIYEFPFLAGVTFAGFILPQAIGLTNYVFLPEGAVSRIVLMSSLCALACYLGYSLQAQPLRTFNLPLNTRRLLQGAIFLIVLGGTAFAFYIQFPMDSSRLSGTPVALYFFARLVPYGFALAIFIYFRTGSQWAMMWSVIGSWFFIYRGLFVLTKRGVLAEFIFIVLLGFWFYRKKAVPRYIMVVGLLCVMLIGNFNMDKIRPLSRDGLTVSEIISLAEVNWMSSIDNTLSGEDEVVAQAGGGELEAAAYYADAIAESGGYDFGLSHWNGMVFSYIPAQLFGEEFKKSLYLDLGRESSDPEAYAYNQWGYEQRSGLTSTGMLDAFRSFWYLGWIKFAVIGFIMRRFYLSAKAGSLFGQAMYALLIVSSLHAITHGTNRFFRDVIHVLVFVYPIFWYAQMPANGKAERPSVAKDEKLGL